MSRILLRLILLLLMSGAVISVRMGSQPAWLSRALPAEWLEFGKKADPSASEYEALASLDDYRASKKLPFLEHDDALHKALADTLREAPLADLSMMLNSIQNRLPNYTRVAAFSTTRGLHSGLTDDLNAWKDSSEPQFNSAAVLTRTGREADTVVVVAQRLPILLPESINATTQTSFFSLCPHCGKGAMCEIAKKKFTLSLECPHCRHITTIIAADLHGDMHFANEYLTGYAPPAHLPKNCTRLEEMLVIWRAVGAICHYKQDTDDVVNDPEDAWQFAPETLKLGTGDCEDSAIMLTDWLTSRGFEARVALGRYSERGGHAWVVVRLEGKEYLLESTMPDSKSAAPPLASEVGSRYIPEAMLDYDTIHVRKSPRAPWDGGYFEDEQWLRITPRQRTAKPLHEVARTELREAIARTFSTAADGK